MPASSYSPVLMLTVVALATGLAALVIACLVQSRRAAAGGAGRCGKCGYAVHGLTTFVCPECGGDLRDVGIETRPKRSVWAPLVVAVIAGFLGLMVCTAGLYWSVRSRAMGTQTATLRAATVRVAPPSPAPLSSEVESQLDPPPAGGDMER